MENFDNRMVTEPQYHNQVEGNNLNENYYLDFQNLGANEGYNFNTNKENQINLFDTQMSTNFYYPSQFAYPETITDGNEINYSPLPDQNQNFFLLPSQNVNNAHNLAPQKPEQDLFHINMEINMNMNINNSIYNPHSESALLATQEHFLYSTPYTYSFSNPAQNFSLSSKTQHREEKEKYLRENLILKCESFINQILNKLQNNEKLEIYIIDLEKNSRFNFNLGFYTLKQEIHKKSGSGNVTKYLKYDLYNNSDKLAKIIKICNIIYTKSIKNSSTTKRELYYNDVELFKNTNCIDTILQDICHLFDICRFDLTVFPAQKGLFAGNIKIFDNEGNLLNHSSTWDKINLISYEYYLEEITVESSADFILVVEKESIFFNLLNNQIFRMAFPNCILVTGKGYPDYMTKYFLHKIFYQIKNSHVGLNQIKLFYFGDYDPHGIEIFLNYMFGCKNSSRENFFMCVNEIQWIGLSYQEIMEIIKKEGEDSISLIKTDEKDFKKIDCMFGREFFNFNGWANSEMETGNKFSILNNLDRIKNELLLIKENGFKAEGETIISKYMEFFVYILNNCLMSSNANNFIAHNNPCESFEYNFEDENEYINDNYVENPNESSSPLERIDNLFNSFY